MTEKVIYRCNELGGCTLNAVAGRLGYTKLPVEDVKMKNGEPIKNLFAEGQRLEQVALERLDDELAVATHRYQEEVEIEVLPGIWLVGHPDAVHIMNLYGIEIKSMRPAYYNQFLEKGFDTPGLIQKYRWQWSAYRWIMGIPFYLCIIDSDPEEEDDFSRRMEFIQIPQEAYLSMNQIKSRVLTIEAWARRGELPDGCDTKQFPCSTYYLETNPNYEYSDNDVLRGYAEEYYTANKWEKLAKKSKAHAKEGLEEVQKPVDREASDKVESFKTDCGELTINWYKQRNPSGFNVDLMRADNVYDKYRQEGEKGWRVKVEKKEIRTI